MQYEIHVCQTVDIANMLISTTERKVDYMLKMT